ncbi:CHAT domain-containing protein [Pannus brasiliensis CCIBt3594]|uniref:CHAT domain-containing protein n=1 Tax=Pannus brasiliensis CCIBt3594 TaxID=1427578 RepID=A0AAW9QVZ1_9CHRO
MKRQRSLPRVIALFVLSLVLSLGAARIAPASPNPPALVQQAKTGYQNGRFAEAARDWRTAAEAFAGRGDTLNQAMALSNLALTYQALGEWEKAARSSAESLDLLQNFPETPDRDRVLAGTLDIQARGQLAIGRPTAALENWQKAALLYQKLDDRDGAARARIDESRALQALGLYPRARDTLLDVLGIDRSPATPVATGLPEGRTRLSIPVQILALRELGGVFRAIGENDRSRLVLERALQLSRESGNEEESGDIYLSLGNTARVVGDSQPSRSGIETDCLASVDRKTDFHARAAACYRQAESTPRRATRVRSLLNQLSLSVQKGKWSEIERLIPAIDTELPRVPPDVPAINERLNYVQSLICLRTEIDPTPGGPVATVARQCRRDSGLETAPASLRVPSWGEIEGIARIAYDRAETLGNERALANALGYLAGISQQTGDLPRARQLTERALQILAPLNSPETSYLWQWQMGQLYRQQGRIPEAIAVYNLAFDNLQALRQDLAGTSRERQFSFRDSVEPVYREFADLLLQGETPSQENLKSARNVIESLQLAELNNFFQEACLETQSGPIDAIDPRAAVFYSIVLPDRLAVILSLPGQPLQYYATPVASSSVEGTFEDLFADLGLYVSSEDPLKPRQKFYDWMIRPARERLKEGGITTLVFVSDGILRNLPVAALHDGQQYLVEQYDLALTPSLQLLSPGSSVLGRRDILAGGITESRQGFAALPGVKQEVSEISGIAPTEVLLDEQFTRSRLRGSIESRSFPIVHLATHGQFSSRADNTFLLTWDERINVKDLDRLLERPDPIELLILSACQTAVGDKRAALGLAGMAVRARAKSTMATLWAVQDRSTAELMTEFYRVLKQSGATKASALRQAQLTLLKDKRYQHPYYWAAFVLVGNWL